MPPPVQCLEAMDARGAEALRKYLEAHHGGQVPDTAHEIEGTGAAALERWFKVRDEHTDPGTTESTGDNA
jgi:hypothetical protein